MEGREELEGTTQRRPQSQRGREQRGRALVGARAAAPRPAGGTTPRGGRRGGAAAVVLAGHVAQAEALGPRVSACVCVIAHANGGSRGPRKDRPVLLTVLHHRESVFLKPLGPLYPGPRCVGLPTRDTVAACTGTPP